MLIAMAGIGCANGKDAWAREDEAAAPKSSKSWLGNAVSFQKSKPRKP
jgi:hypothetical protein